MKHDGTEDEPIYGILIKKNVCICHLTSANILFTLCEVLLFFMVIAMQAHYVKAIYIIPMFVAIAFAKCTICMN